MEKKISKRSNAKPQKRHWKFSDTIIVAFIGLLGTIIAAFLGSPLIEKWLVPVSTVTMTSTATEIQAASATSETLVPVITSTDILTPTPIVLKVLRSLDLRNGCYDDYPTVIQIPEGAIVLVLPSLERRFDKLNRECVLVEYPNRGQSFVGWVLLIDLSYN